MKQIPLLLLLSLMITPVLAQEHNLSEHHSHSHSRNEIGVGVGAAYEIGHKEWAAAYHLHYFRTITPHSRWALGGGLECLSGDESHTEIGVGVRYAPIDRLHITLLPGVTFGDKIQFSLHAEAIYEVLHIGNFHLGPVVGYGWSKDHSHLSAGVHAAISF